ncbi:MAG: aldo/keto reductase [bacterium]|nr:aldo/keto reductase [bacterium]
MKSRLLGKDGFKVSEIGMGCWQIGGNWGPNISDVKGMDILLSAYESGITFFDTADVYGDGKSEELIGKFIKNYNKPIKVATKFGHDSNVYPNNYSKNILFSSVELSLKRLGLESLDLLQLHCVPTEIIRNGEIFDWLRELKNEGKIKHFGASVETIEEGLICLKRSDILSLQVIFNIFRQKLITDLLPQAKAKGVGIIARVPLASGLLTGKFTKSTQFMENDHRNFNKNGDFFNVGETFAGIPFEKGVELVDELRQFLPPGVSMIQMALRWLLDNDAISTVIAGASSERQVRANADISQLSPLSKELHNKLTEFYTTKVHNHVRGVY